jgi:protein involved in polysaccharide export with SLBB domain
MAGGLSEKHGSSAIIVRPHKSDNEIPQYERIIININGLLKGHPADNIILEPGDIVDILTQEDLIYVTGEVNAPSSFPYVEGMSLRKVISLAQGTTFNAAASETVIYRDDPLTGKRQEIRVDLPAIMTGKKEDIVIHPNDLIIVPSGIIKPIPTNPFRFIDTPPFRGLPTIREATEKRG